MKIIASIKSNIRKFKIFWMLNFRRDLLKKSLSLRKEKDVPDDYCIKCQECCKNCIAISKDGCKIWKDTDYRCKVFPMFSFQLDTKSKKIKCKYYWEEKNIKNKNKVTMQE
jgi:hypothetical protein